MFPYQKKLYIMFIRDGAHIWLKLIILYWLTNIFPNICFKGKAIVSCFETHATSRLCVTVWHDIASDLSKIIVVQLVLFMCIMIGFYYLSPNSCLCILCTFSSQNNIAKAGVHWYSCIVTQCHTLKKIWLISIKCVVLDVVGSRSWCSLRTRLFTDLGARPWLVLYIVVDFVLLECGYFFAGFWTQEMSCVSVMVFGLADLRC